MKIKRILSFLALSFVFGLSACSLDKIIDFAPGTVGTDQKNDNYKIVTLVNSFVDDENKNIYVPVKLGDIFNLTEQMSKMPEIENMKFEGWYTDEAFKNKYDFETVTVEDNLTFYAKYNNYFTVTFKANGEVIGTESVLENDFVSDNVPRDYYQNYDKTEVYFNGTWLYNGKEYIFGEEPVIANMTLIADIQNVYSYVFYNGSEIFDFLTFTDKKNAPPVQTSETPVNNSNDGFIYYFTSWKLDRSKSTTYKKVYVAQYDKYGMARFYNDSKLLFSQEVKTGEKANYQGITPTKTSFNSSIKYTFKGWGLSSDVDPVVDFTINKPIVDYYALFDKDEFVENKVNENLTSSLSFNTENIFTSANYEAYNGVACINLAKSSNTDEAMPITLSYAYSTSTDYQNGSIISVKIYNTNSEITATRTNFEYKRLIDFSTDFKTVYYKFLVNYSGIISSRYEIKYVDKNGKTTYSDEKEINVSYDCTVNIDSLNSIQDDLVLEYNSKSINFTIGTGEKLSNTSSNYCNMTDTSVTEKIGGTYKANVSTNNIYRQSSKVDLSYKGEKFSCDILSLLRGFPNDDEDLIDDYDISYFLNSLLTSSRKAYTYNDTNSFKYSVSNQTNNHIRFNFN